MKNYSLNKNAVVEKIDDDYMVLLDNKIFQINAYGFFIIDELCNNNVSLKQLISKEVTMNEDIDEDIIKNKINQFVNELVSKDILFLIENNGENNG